MCISEGTLFVRKSTMRYVISVTVKSKLVQYYCCDLYGGVLWEPDVEDICSAWRKGLSRVWGLLYHTHSALMYRISNMLPLKYELAYRALTFVHKSLTCNKNIVNFAVRHGVFFARMFSVIGRNVQFCSDLFGVSMHNSKIDKSKCGIFYVSMIRVCYSVGSVLYNWATVCWVSSCWVGVVQCCRHWFHHWLSLLS